VRPPHRRGSIRPLVAALALVVAGCGESEREDVPADVDAPQQQAPGDDAPGGDPGQDSPGHDSPGEDLGDDALDEEQGALGDGSSGA
jgi:hypothetical protein